MSRNFELLVQLETQLEEKSGASLPILDRIAARDRISLSAGDAYQEEMLRLVQRVFLSVNGTAPRQVVFVGINSGNGSTSVCAAAARTLAAGTSKSVCVIDANLRSPRLASLLGIADTIPIFRESTSKGEGCVQIGRNLWFGGTDLLSDDGGALLHVDQLKERLAQLGSTFQFVLIDTPGMNLSEDASKLGQCTDAAILIIDANCTRRLTARKAIGTLEASGVKLLGTVLHNRSFPIPEKLYKRL